MIPLQMKSRAIPEEATRNNSLNEEMTVRIGNSRGYDPGRYENTTGRVDRRQQACTGELSPYRSGSILYWGSQEAMFLKHRRPREVNKCGSSRGSTTQN